MFVDSSALRPLGASCPMGKSSHRGCAPLLNLILSYSLSPIKPTALRQLELILEVTGPSLCTAKIVKEMGVVVLGLKIPWHIHDTNNATTTVVNDAERAVAQLHHYVHTKYPVTPFSDADSFPDSAIHYHRLDVPTHPSSACMRMLQALSKPHRMWSTGNQRRRRQRTCTPSVRCRGGVCEETCLLGTLNSGPGSSFWRWFSVRKELGV
jgi:hypothetical protein